MEHVQRMGFGAMTILAKRLTVRDKVIELRPWTGTGINRSLFEPIPLVQHVWWELYGVWQSRHVWLQVEEMFKETVWKNHETDQTET